MYELIARMPDGYFGEHAIEEIFYGLYNKGTDAEIKKAEILLMNPYDISPEITITHLKTKDEIDQSIWQGIYYGQMGVDVYADKDDE